MPLEPTLSRDAAPEPAAARPTFAYAAVGATVTGFAVNVESGALTEQGSVTLPARVQYAWPHATLPILYVGCADRGAGGAEQPFYLCVVTRDERGGLGLGGDPLVLPKRPIHLTTDRSSRHVLVAYGEAPGLSVYRTNEDGTVGAEVPRAEPFDFGEKPHQVRAAPANGRAILVARGKKGFGKPGYAEGAFKLVRFDGGQVENVGSVSPAEGQAPRGFNPRNVDFHPSEPLLFASLEAQNELAVFRMEGGDVDPTPLFLRNYLAKPDDLHKRQDGGEVFVHPNGRYVYVANRNDGYVDGRTGPSWLNPDPIPVFPGGENNIAVFALDPASGEPTLIQHEDTRGLDARTFGLDPSGRLLIAASIAPTVLEDGDGRTEVPAGLSVFRVGDDGRLSFVGKHVLDIGLEKLLWMGIVG